MRTSIEKSMLIANLQRQILQWQGFKQVIEKDNQVGLGELEKAFPNHAFPLGSIHEFISENLEEEASSSGFMAGLLPLLMQKNGISLWIGSSHALFTPAIKLFGLDPDRIIFVQMKQQQDILWALEEGLKCEGVSVVVAEVADINFSQSRRLQLAVEQSRVTGFVLRLRPRFLGATACAVRWHIRPLPSWTEGDLPGVGFPSWEVNLLKVRNGSPSRWEVVWKKNGLQMKRLALFPRLAEHAKRKIV